MLHLLPSAAAAALAVALFTGSAAAGTQDAWITTKAKLSLLTTEGVSGTAINVDTVDNQVTLHGKVQSAGERDKAQAVVAKIDGVKGVRNLLQVVPAAQEKSVEVADAQVKDQVDKALEADQSLADSSVDVQSVNKGVVLLGGKANSLSDHLRAVEIAALVPGVRRVVTEVSGPDQLAKNEFHIDVPPEKVDDPGISTTARDAWITSMTKLRLMADGDTPALDINVDTQNGIVTLFGVVPTNAAKAAAEADARKVSGVKGVRNELQVVPKEQAKAVEIRDDQLEERVESSLAARQELKRVEVEVENGVVRLTGSVPSQGDRLEAAIIARATTGVRSVRDDLAIAD